MRARTTATRAKTKARAREGTEHPIAGSGAFSVLIKDLDFLHTLLVSRVCDCLTTTQTHGTAVAQRTHAHPRPQLGDRSAL